MKQFCIYILASHHDEPTLYIGVTSKLEQRIWQHQTKFFPGFTARYNCDKLVYFEIADSAEAAITREKQLKNWRRQWKLDLIKTNNPNLKDLSRELSD